MVLGTKWGAVTRETSHITGLWSVFCMSR